MMDSGDVVLLTVPIYDGYVLPHDTPCLDLAERFFSMSPEDPHRVRVPSTTTAESETGCDVKEELSYLAFDYDTELKSTAKRP